ncbi:Hypothetical_protein [Hexamita inflata]|uniref:Hypothetical_protein n=1 Tax=Hexamita inflata TaxID=28002 RepID=A0AA86NJ32_9EUKA|nr:Hypothetical protein HINF_LOCUS8607 [Hexamita inflata]
MQIVSWFNFLQISEYQVESHIMVKETYMRVINYQIRREIATEANLIQRFFTIQQCQQHGRNVNGVANKQNNLNNKGKLVENIIEFVDQLQLKQTQSKDLYYVVLQNRQ